MKDDSLSLEAADGQRIYVYGWLPGGTPKAVVQIAHGAAEHAGRYARVAAVLVTPDAVYANVTADTGGPPHSSVATASPASAAGTLWSAMLAS
jgi:hypothetical protein